MKPKNISFAEVLRGKARSPQPEVKLSGSTLLQYFQEWEQYPEEDYTLYLGSFKNSWRSKNSAVPMFASRNCKNQDDQMFDSWIQRQSAINANKENLSLQPKRLLNPLNCKPPQPVKLISNSKDTSKCPETAQTFKATGGTFKATVGARHLQVQQPRMTLKHLQNIGGNIQMIKSNTCEKEEISQVRSPRRQTEEDISLQVEEVRQNREYQIKERVCEEENKRLVSLKSAEEKFENDRETMKKQQINELIYETTNHIHDQVADLARKYCQNSLQKSKHSNSSQEAEEDEELLIGFSGRKPLGPSQQKMFSEDYQQKAKQEDEIQKMRREEAKVKLTNLIKEINNKGNQGVNWSKQVEKMEPIQIQINHAEEFNGGVGYSFASSAFGSGKEESASKQLRISNIPEIKSEMPSLAHKSQEEDNDFRKKYVKEDFALIPSQNIANVQSIHSDIFNSIRQDEHQTFNAPNSSFKTKFITKQNDNSLVQPIQEAKIQIFEPIKQQVQLISKTVECVEQTSRVSSVHGIKVSLNEQKQVAPVLNFSKEGKMEGSGGIKSSVSVDNQRDPNQRIKLVSSKKLKVYSNSGKSSPAVSNQSHEKPPVIHLGGDIKTKPFAVGVDLGLPQSQKERIKPSESCSNQADNFGPFTTIAQVKQPVKNNYKLPSPEVHAKSNLDVISKQTNSFTVENYLVPHSKYPTYALPTQTANYTHTYQSHYAVSANTYQKSSKTSSQIATNYALTENNVNLPSYGTKDHLVHLNTHQIYQTRDSNDFRKKTFQNQFSSLDRQTSQNLGVGKKQQKIFTFQQPEPSYEDKKEGRRSYLQGLELKQSITVEEPKPVVAVRMGGRKEEVKGLLDQQLKQSMKESKTLKASNQFTFDF